MKLWDRMKEYESCSSYKLVRKMPVIIRVDWRAFHTFTRWCEKPFDNKIIEAMQYATIETAKEMQSFKLAYVQSDEASFYICDDENNETEAWFNNKLSKILSITASLFTFHFNKKYWGDRVALFDARAFNIPLQEVPNIFIWRQRDWERNSIQMLWRSNFSHSELHRKSKEDIVQMLIERSPFLNWNNLLPILKYWTFVKRDYSILGLKIQYEDFNNLIIEKNEE